LGGSTQKQMTREQTKSVVLSDETHKSLKKYCAERGLKMSSAADKIIKKVVSK